MLLATPRGSLFISVPLQSLAQWQAHRRGLAKVLELKGSCLQFNERALGSSTFVADIIRVSNAENLTPSGFLLGQAGQGSCPGERSHLWPFHSWHVKALSPTLDATQPNAVHSPRLIANVFFPANAFLIPLVRIFSSFSNPLEARCVSRTRASAFILQISPCTQSPQTYHTVQLWHIHLSLPHTPWQRDWWECSILRHYWF